MCQESDTIGHLKEQILLANKKEIKADHMRLINPKDNQPFEDDSDKILQHEDLKDDSELYVIFQISDGEWESVHVEDTAAAVGGDNQMDPIATKG
jgi:hypothetical protein